MATRGTAQRGHDLGETGPTGDRGDAHLAGCARVTVGHGAGAVLVPRVHDPHFLLLGHRRAPVHIRVPEQREHRVHALCGEGLCQYVITQQVSHNFLFPFTIRTLDRCRGPLSTIMPQKPDRFAQFHLPADRQETLPW
jgi:hypothetical protein